MLLIELFALTSCKENLQKQKENAISNNIQADTNGLNWFPVSYDVAGQGTAMGLTTGNVHVYSSINSVEFVIMQRRRKKQ